MTSKINAVDLSAKLLATENISVRRARAKTASFDIGSRVLTIPMWKDMSPTVEGMLIGHEVGHALYTTEEMIEPAKENSRIFGYLNVLEDVRIEKLMKRKYPGIRKTMNEGYKELNEQDFFGVKKEDPESLLLIDRINLYFKAGFACGVKFTPEEKQFVERAEKTETPQDVIALAKEVYEFSKEDLEKRIREQMLQEPEEPEFDGYEDLDGLDEIDEDFDAPIMNDADLEKTGETSEDGGFSGQEKDVSLGKTQKTKEEQIQEAVEEQIQSKTDRAFYSKLEELADESTDFLYYKLDSDYAFDPVVSYKTVLNETTLADEYFTPEVKSDFDKFKTEASRVVNYLTKEFEMKKSAQLYKRSQTSKVGSLDMRKVWAYKLNDDLFKRVTTLPQGKNHGMVFLLDWSGSMDPVLQDTVKQVITLAMFCQRNQIPYRVFAFSSNYSMTATHIEGMTDAEITEASVRYHKLRNKVLDLPDNLLTNACSDFAMLEFMSSKMSNVEFNSMIRRLFNTNKFRWCKNNEYQTGGTPLNEALAYMIDYIPKFISSSGVEKMTLITLTDGEGHGLQAKGRYSLDDYRIDTSDGYKKVKQKHFLQDEVTKKSYVINRYGNFQTEAILRMIKDRFGIGVVGFYVCQNNRRDLTSALKNNLPGFNGNSYAMIDVMRKEFRDDGFFSMKNTGRDDLFIIPASSMKIDDSEIAITEKQSAKQIARQFAKVMSGKKTSRVLLNKFIDYVA
jgi:hypothetical protein